MMGREHASGLPSIKMTGSIICIWMIALENGYHGIYTIGQDNNLSADLFYLKNGFEIGGFNTQVYKGTKQEGKSDIYFYLDIE